MKNSIRIYNGNQIGGCVTIISTQQAKIVIDYGEQLPGSKVFSNYKIDWDKEQVDAVLFTHYHGDHIGRFKEIPESVPKLYMGKVTRKVMQIISKHIHDENASRILEDDSRVREVRAARSFKIGDMNITPYIVDHSAYDAYMYLIETPDKTILHTGDFREHGYRGKGLLPVIEEYIRNRGKRKIDVLIMEGTMMSRLSEKPYSETDMKRDAIKLFEKKPHAFLICSSTNVDSLATFYQAAQKHDMTVYANDYVCEQLEMYSEEIKKFTNLYDYQYVCSLSKTKGREAMMRKDGFLMVIKAEKKYKHWIDKFADLKPIVIYSMWEGYLDPTKPAYIKEWKEFLDDSEKICGPYKSLHTSGHASADTLAKVIEAVEPQEAIIPIHTENAGGFRELEIREELKNRIKEIDLYEW